MNIYFLRHGLAADPGFPGIATDFDRPLTAEGKRKVAQITAAMKVMELKFDRIYSSPYVRAHQTATIVAKAFGARKRFELTDTLAPDGDTKELVKLLKQNDPLPEGVLLVGHEPFLSGLISLLVWGQPGAAVTMKKGGLCQLSAGNLKHGRCAALEWLLTPGQMKRMR